VKILHITPVYEPAWGAGGVVRVISQFCRGLARLGLDVSIYTTNFGNGQKLQVPVDRMVELGGVKVRYFKTDFFHKYAYSRSLAQAVRRHTPEFDLIILSTFWCYPGIPAGMEARKRGVPYIIFPAGSISDYALAYKHLKKKLYLKLIEERNLRHARALRYVVEMERERSAHLNLSTPSFVIPNGLLVEEFQNLPEKAQAKEIWGLEPDTQVILYLGRLVHGKGLELLMKAFSQAVARHPRSVLVLAGPDFGLESNLKALASQVGIDSHVMFTGYVPPERRNSLLRAADLLALLSDGESFGMVALEAMWAGVPVLLSDKVGLCREVAADEAGVVVPLDQEIVTQALEDLMIDPERLAYLGQKAWDSARERFENNKVCRLMATAYEDVLSGRRSPGLSWSDGHSGRVED
jgi:glycosyltransferase involved in cell wall biosynthesis